jgi:hypothetical protein
LAESGFDVLKKWFENLAIGADKLLITKFTAVVATYVLVPFRNPTS